MIILITGASHTGKTLLAQRMLEKHKYPYLSIDHLKMGLIRSGNTALTPEDDDSLTEYLWPIVREIIKTAIENQQNLIIEGCYIPFDWRQDFDERYLPSIRFICLAMTDKYIDAHFDSIKEHGSDIESRLDDTAYTINNLKADNRRYIEGHRRSGEQITLIDTDYELTINTLLAEKHMGKALSDMTTEELWELFPIILTEHKEIWDIWYAEEQKRLAGILPPETIRISHIGSTAIKSIWAKPIIDILVELPMSLPMGEIKELLIQNGYTCMSEQQDRSSFNRGYTSEGFAEKVFHLHLRYEGDNDELYFRDCLNEDPLLAKQYEELKLSLWKEFEHDRDGYTLAKTDFIAEQTDKAKKYYGHRY